MVAVRLLFIAILAVDLAGVPARAVSPCAATGMDACGCCVHHRTEPGGNAVGHCGCRVVPEPAGDLVVVSMPVQPVGDSTHAMAPMGADAAVKPADVGVAHPTLSVAGDAHSPPRLSGSGFRC